jgi:hypothetical protein
MGGKKLGAKGSHRRTARTISDRAGATGAGAELVDRFGAPRAACVRRGRSAATRAAAPRSPRVVRSAGAGEQPVVAERRVVEQPLLAFELVSDVKRVATAEGQRPPPEPCSRRAAWRGPRMIAFVRAPGRNRRSRWRRSGHESWHAGLLPSCPPVSRRCRPTSPHPAGECARSAVYERGLRRRGLPSAGRLATFGHGLEVVLGGRKLGRCNRVGGDLLPDELTRGGCRALEISFEATCSSLGEPSPCVRVAGVLTGDARSLAASANRFAQGHRRPATYGDLTDSFVPGFREPLRDDGRSERPFGQSKRRSRRFPMVIGHRSRHRVRRAME